MGLLVRKLDRTYLKLYVMAKVLLCEEAGQDLVEYAVLCALIGGLAVAAIPTISNTIANMLTTMGTQANNVINNS